MKRIERNTLNRLRKTVTPDTVYVEIPETWTHEGRQAIHELLTIEKHMKAVSVSWSVIDEGHVILYARNAAGELNPQEAEDIDNVTQDLPRTDYAWNGHKKPGTTPDPEPTTEENEGGNKTMTTTTTPAAALTPAQKAFRTVEARRDHVTDLLQNLTTAARIELIQMLSRAVAYHKNGKIEGLFSLDVACSNCDFCQRMQKSDDPTIICTYCYTESMKALPKLAHHITGMILSGMDLTDAEAAAVAIPAGSFRFNSDGELINQTHARNLLKLAKAHPLTTFAVWTKRPYILHEAIAAEGKPGNLICGISSERINAPRMKTPAWADFVFTVYTPAGMAAALDRGEYPCNGRKCLDCGFHCYRKHPDHNGPVYVAEALRKPAGVTAATFSDLMARIDAATL